MSLNNKNKKNFKRQAHTLSPVVLIGKHGVTDAVINEIDLALQAHELIKIRLPKITTQEQQESINSIITALNAELIQVIGHIVVLFRKKIDKS